MTEEQLDELGYLDSESEKEFMKIVGRPSRKDAKCATCRFWQETEGPTWSKHANNLIELGASKIPGAINWDGHCKRHSPVLAVICPEDSKEPGTYFPTTEWNDWCGDYDTVKSK